MIPGRCRGPYYNLLGYFSSALDRYDRADKYFEMALKINPEDTVASVNKARNYLKTGDIAKIQPLIRRLKEVNIYITNCDIVTIVRSYWLIMARTRSVP